MQVDQFAHKYTGWSPYNYSLNNPVVNVDPDGNYVKRQNNLGQTIFQQWTVEGAFAQLRKENEINDFVNERRMRNDPSFNIQPWESVYEVPYFYISLIDALADGIGILTNLAGINKTRQYLTSFESNLLRLDEKIFNAVNLKYIGGVKLAKYDYKTKTLELSDEMRKKKQEEGLTPTQIDEYWKKEFMIINDEQCTIFRWNTDGEIEYDPYDAKNH